jgi:GT2 family glycosyltransferase
MERWPAGPREALSTAGSPPICIVIPVYNGEARLLRTLESLAAQSFRAWRAVVVDDGSTDRSRAIAGAFAARDPRFTVVSQANGGVSSAVNRGMAETDSPWVLFLDADDTLHRDGLKRLAAAAGEGVDIVVGRVTQVTPDGKVWRDARPDLGRPWEALSRSCAFPVHAALVRRRMVVDLGGWDEGLRTNEDWDLWARIARAGAVFRPIRKVVGYYWNWPSSLSKDRARMAADALEVLRRIHGPDPRTPPQSAHAEGLSPDRLGVHALPYLLYLAACEAAEGGRARWLEGAVSPDVGPWAAAHVRLLGEAVVGGVAEAMAAPPSALAGAWPGLARPLAEVLARAFPGEAMAAPRDLMLLVVKDRLGARFGDGAADETPAVTQLALDLGAGVAAPAARPGRGLAVQVRKAGRSLGVALAPAPPDGRAPDVPALVLDQFDRFSMQRAARALRPWRRARFWRSLARDVLSGGLGRGEGRAAFTRAAACVVRAGMPG